LWPLAYWISSTPIASIWPSTRCFSPKVTTCSTAATVDAPHGVQKEDEKTPQGDELKAPLGELVVTGRGQMAARADSGGTLPRSHGHFDALLVGTEVGVLVDKAPETMAAV